MPKPLYHKRTGLTAIFRDPYWVVDGFDAIAFGTKKEVRDWIRQQPNKEIAETRDVALALATIQREATTLTSSLVGLNSHDARRVLKFLAATKDSLNGILQRPAYREHLMPRT